MGKIFVILFKYLKLIIKKILLFLIPKSYFDKVWIYLKKIYHYFFSYETRNLFEGGGETTKAAKRRKKEGFFKKYFLGYGLDIGYGGDKVVPNCDGWDVEDGNAQYLDTIIDNKYDFVYSSHCLEHMIDIETTLKNWIRVLKKYGHLILYIPDRDLYEKKITLPSNWNKDHKHYFTMYDQKDGSKCTIPIIPFIESKFSNLSLIYSKKCNYGHTITDPKIHSDGEYSIELVYKKLKNNKKN